ncbi:hypothetical protein FACS189451_03820 [Bacteroidia bacterium]|nr:hypothetical protein FACS189446_1620 [Bacteroidia bacterium]GHT61556.1 hypothetical protein FACS189451_03820 [Bacteroidia bacterium]
MKMKNLYLLGLLMTICWGCEEYIAPIDTTLQPGHILCSDGSLVHPSYFAESGKEAIGIVFWINEQNDPTIPEKGFAVSLQDSPHIYWANINEHVDNVSSNETDFLGAANTVAIISWGQKDSIPTPAADYTLFFSPHNVTGWFIPSAGQMKAIHSSINKIYSSLEVVGGEKFSNIWYWSSTEDGTGSAAPDQYALIVSLTEGRVTNSDKKLNHPVRPVIAIR